MSRYWNKIVIDKLFAHNKKQQVKYRLNTDIGRFYFYFEKDKDFGDEKISGKLVFFPDVGPRPTNNK